MRWSPVGGTPGDLSQLCHTYCQPGSHFFVFILIFFLQQGPQHLPTIHHFERRVITGPPAQLAGQLCILTMEFLGGSPRGGEFRSPGALSLCLNAQMLSHPLSARQPQTASQLDWLAVDS